MIREVVYLLQVIAHDGLIDSSEMYITQQNFASVVDEISKRKELSYLPPSFKTPSPLCFPSSLHLKR